MAIVAIKRDFTLPNPAPAAPASGRRRARIDPAYMSAPADDAPRPRIRLRAPVTSGADLHPAAASAVREPADDAPRPRIRRRAPVPAPNTAVPDTASPVLEPADSAGTEYAPEDAATEAPPKKKRRRGVAVKGPNGKWQAPEGNKKGFCCPPVDHQFKGKAGPGRPRGSRSQDSYMREALDKQVPIRIDGVTRKMKKRQLIAELVVNTAVETKTFKYLQAAHETASRLYPERTHSEASASPLGEARLDEMLLRQFFAGLALGEPGPGMEGAFALDAVLGFGAQALARVPNDEEDATLGDWNAPGEPEPGTAAGGSSSPGNAGDKYPRGDASAGGPV